MIGRADHIFVFFRDFALGGVEVSALGHMREWIAAGRRVTLFVGNPEGPLKQRLPEGLEVIEGRSGKYLKLFAPVIRAVRAAEPDVIFVPGNYYTAIGMALRLALGASAPPMIVKISNSFALAAPPGLARFAYHRFVRLQRQLFDHFVALSPGLAREAESIARIGRLQLITIGDPPAATPPAPQCDASPRIAAVGRLGGQKRFDRLLRAFALLPTDPVLEIVGDGPDRSALEHLAAQLGIAHRVIFHGYLENPLEVVARARVLAISSDFEGLPAVASEALAAGTPVVTTDCSPALREVVSAPVLGTVVPREDISAFAAALRSRVAVRPDRDVVRSTAQLPTWSDSSRRYLVLFDGYVRRRAASAARVLGPARRPSRAAPAAIGLGVAAALFAATAAAGEGTELRAAGERLGREIVSMAGSAPAAGAPVTPVETIAAAEPDRR